MARNVEIKARLRDPAAFRKRAEALSGGSGEKTIQVDTFFNAQKGRLKLREGSPHTAELIFYERPDRTGPKTSDYVVREVPANSNLREVLSIALGVMATVKKEREVFLVGRTRIHLDRVAQLGTFMELEVVLTESESEKAGEVEAADLMLQLGIDASDLIDCAYADLILQESALG